jgi:Ca-activated chloride channel homolog
MKMLLWVGGSAVTAVAVGVGIAVQVQKPRKQPALNKPVKQVKIDLDKAIDVPIPTGKGLEAIEFKTKDGKTGWAVHIPGNRPIATPAYYDGRIFVGGGFGSHEFYAFDADTGKLAWQIKTSDDGPTAALVEDGCVCFNTESCTVIVTDAKTGKLIWQEWLGDPLMSQPAASQGRLYIAYPAGQQKHPANKTKGYGFRMLCADLHTGKHYWETEIPTDVISAPVIEGDSCYFTCMDGTSMNLDARTGAVLWKKQNSGASAPLIVGGQVVMTQKEVTGGKAYEGLRRLDAKQGHNKDKDLVSKGSADYLQRDKGGGVGISKAKSQVLDSSVGFSVAPQAAKMQSVNGQLGVNSVVGGWSYQGSRAGHSNGLFYNAQGLNLNSMDAAGKARWRAETNGKGIGKDEQIFSPPAMGAKNMYLSSARGHLLAVSQSDGSPKFMYNLKQPIVFQPALARGNMYVGTANGLVICLRTGDRDADGWTMWGGNAQHNKASKKK